MIEKLDYSKTYLQNRKTKDLIKFGEDYLVYPLGTKLYQLWYNNKRIREFEIYGIEIMGAGIEYSIRLISEDWLYTARIPEKEIGNDKWFKLENPLEKVEA